MMGLELLTLCAPPIAPQTLAKVIEVESQGDPLALHINGTPLPRRPVDRDDAVRLAKAAIARGYTVDLGLMQVNSQHLPVLGYTLEAMFNPCINIRVGAQVLAGYYEAAAKLYGTGQRALQAALSAYNTGDFKRGFLNGYVARYYRDKYPRALAWEQAPPPTPLTAATTVYTRNQGQLSIPPGEAGVRSHPKPHGWASSRRRVSPKSVGGLGDLTPVGLQRMSCLPQGRTPKAKQGNPKQFYANPTAHCTEWPSPAFPIATLPSIAPNLIPPVDPCQTPQPINTEAPDG